MNREKEQEKQKLCRRYCRELRRALVCVPELRERTLAQLTESIEEYLDEHPTADYQELVRVFGTPAQAAENVLNEMDAKQVQQLLKKYQWRRVLAIVLAGLLIACAICLIAYGVFYLYRHFIRINRITISAGVSGLLLSFCFAAVSGTMPQKASFSKTFCHKLPDFA